ncbi:hypothetical protein I79_009839 [Cricetulus griseus]|uniref:Uncharacterized protein n=1 Tax=Cricetulus griseus TaxID=10029 RepID=G3HGU8_CRIGR|nr:hypothetical protein I79_009839 [Cricetulus griseus]
MNGTGSLDRFPAIQLTVVKQDQKELQTWCAGDSSLFSRLQSSSLIFDYLRIEKKDISLSDSFYI